MLKGIGLKVGATLAFAIMSALVKFASPAFPVSEVVFFRSIFAMATLAVWLAGLGEFPSALKTTRPLGHVGRSLAGTGGMYSNFLALALLPLADATAFSFATPLMVVPLASVVLGEKARLPRAVAVAAGFLGVLVMLSAHLGKGSGGATAGIGALVALCGAGFAAVAIIQTRRLTATEATGAIVFYFSCVTALVSFAVLIAAAVVHNTWSLAAISGQRFVIPNATQFAALAAIGVLGGCGQILMTHCYRFADASILAPFDYVSMLWATILGYLLFFEVPTESVLVGGGIVIAAGIAAIWRERNVWDAARAAKTGA